MEPSKEMDFHWIMKSTPHKRNIGEYSGKWLLFYDISDIDEKWMYIVNNVDKFTGVHNMKCGTAKPNPRKQSSSNDIVIVLYCSGDYEQIMETGRNILSCIADYPYKFIYFKTESQTHDGTRATGCKTNHTFKIEV